MFLEQKRWLHKGDYFSLRQNCLVFKNTSNKYTGDLSRIIEEIVCFKNKNDL